LKILAITLARGGSKGVHKKNIKLLNNKPLIAYTIEEAKKSKFIDKYIVSTDCEEIKKTAILFGADVPFLRDKSLASDTASSVSALQDAVRRIEEIDNCTFDFIVELMCTNPLKTVEDIDACIEKMLNTKADSVIAVHQLEDHHPARIKKIENDHIVDFCVPEIPESRRQDLTPLAFIRSGSIYVMTRKHLMEDGRRYGSVNSRPYVLDPSRAINIDTELDFYLAEFVLQHNV